MPIFTESSSTVIYDDASSSNQPLRKFLDWRKTVPSTTVSNPITQNITLSLDSSQLVFSGTVSTSLAADSVFSLALNPTSSTLYRMTNTSGTAPAFRTDRGLTLSGATITVTVNNNATLKLSTSASNFTSVQVGDTIFIPTVLTGDAASPFSVLNGGYWVVLARTTTTVTLRRPVNITFEGVAELVVLTTNSQVQAFSSTGVQIDDSLEISAGFSTITQKTFVVSSVTPSWVEFVSTESLPLETSITPGVSGLTFYSNAKRFVRVECDQEATLRFNGDTGSFVRLSPSIPSSPSGVAWLESWGNFYSLTIVNRSRSTSMNCVVISVE